MFAVRADNYWLFGMAFYRQFTQKIVLVKAGRPSLILGMGIILIFSIFKLPVSAKTESRAKNASIKTQSPGQTPKSPYNNVIKGLEAIIKDYEQFDSLGNVKDESLPELRSIPLNAPGASFIAKDPNAYVIRGKVRLDLPAVLQLAVANDPKLAQAIALVDERQNLLNSTWGRYWPTLSLNSGGIFSTANGYYKAIQGSNPPYPASTGFNVPTGSYRQELSNTWGQLTGITANYALIDFVRQAALGQASENLRESRELYANRLRELQFAVSEAYYSIQLNQQLKQVFSTEVFNDNAVTSQARALYANGLVPKVDVLRAEASLQQSIYQLKKAEADLLSSQRKLSNLVNVPFDVTLVAMDVVRLQPPWPYDLPTTISLALNDNPQLLAIKFAQKSLLQKSKKQQAALLPSVSIVAGGGIESGSTRLSNRSSNGCCGSSVVPELYQQQYGWSVGILANWLFFDAGVTKGEVNASLAAAKRVEQEEASTRNAIRQNVESAFFDYQASLDQIIAAKASFTAAKEAFRDIRARYQLGLADYTDVSNVVHLLTKAMEDKATAITNTNITYSRMLRELLPVPNQINQPVNLPVVLPIAQPNS